MSWHHKEALKRRCRRLLASGPATLGVHCCGTAAEPWSSPDRCLTAADRPSRLAGANAGSGCPPTIVAHLINRVLLHTTCIGIASNICSVLVTRVGFQGVMTMGLNKVGAVLEESHTTAEAPLCNVLYSGRSTIDSSHSQPLVECLNGRPKLRRDQRARTRLSQRDPRLRLPERCGPSAPVRAGAICSVATGP